VIGVALQAKRILCDVWVIISSLVGQGLAKQFPLNCLFLLE
jgi:hypothetical protein